MTTQRESTTVFRKAGAVALTAAVLLLGACSDEGDEPTGLATGGPTSPASDDPTSTPTADPTPTSTTPAEPAPSFTQPFVPGEPSVIDLPDTLPVEGAENLSEEEQAVVDALGHAMAAWDAMLFGADPETAGLADWFSGDLLGSLTQYSIESMAQQRVSVGNATRIALLDIAVDGEQADLVTCFYTPGWVEYVGGAEGEPVEPVERYAVTGLSRDGAWTFDSAEDLDGEDQCP